MLPKWSLPGSEEEGGSLTISPRTVHPATSPHTRFCASTANGGYITICPDMVLGRDRVPNSCLWNGSPFSEHPATRDLAESGINQITD